ncbi:MAG: hypothetical protein CVV51_14205 [Spirochaetae bacterium HGW-Spirochaetae-7]|jgi:hypothetical protein|nr:MAG: hypothetical protein CVV51_14205 [Spirochaetae bacterium HGW-Spirochaetae-7]
MDESRIFGNALPVRSLKRAERTFKAMARRFSFDPSVYPRLVATPMEGAHEAFGVMKLEEGPAADKPRGLDDGHGIVLGTIRMGFGHYRIGLAIASAARSMGLTPYWLDLMSFPDSAASKTIKYLEDLYNLGSRLSQKSRLFDRYVWDRVTSETAKRLSYTSRDRALSRIFEPILRDLPKDIPFMSTHPWTGQAAVRAGLDSVVALIPDNYPLAFHLVEGAVHTVQAPSLYMGYRTLRDMGGGEELFHALPKEDIRYVGHYVDHEIISAVEGDCAARLKRLRDKETRRFLLTMGGAGAQARRFADIAHACKGALENGKVSLLINMGDHAGRWAELRAWLDADGIPWELHQDWDGTKAFTEEIRTGPVKGVHVFLHKTFFAAVYTTNVLMRVVDVMITKPSELSVYPVPKLFIQHVGKHEVWGAIRGSELGDGTIETASDASLRQVLRLLIEEDDLIEMYCGNILRNARAGIYDGAYGAVHLALERRSDAARADACAPGVARV